MAAVVRLSLALGLLVAIHGAAHAQLEVPYWSMERLELSGFFGVHLSSDTGALGARSGNRATIANSVALGPRLTYLFNDWLLFEGELPLLPSSARDTMEDVGVVVIEPRLAVRLEGVRLRWVVPFGNAGLGMPIALSGNSGIIRNDVSLRPYLGGGVLFPSERKWNWRLDARLFAAAERGKALVTPELELSVSLYRVYGARASKPSLTEWLEERDSDGDGIPDERDKCVDRDEDRDGYEDEDGCPDIDNDIDLVLDIADRCPNDPETHNGFEDEDGCPDTVPAEVQTIVGTVAGLEFRSRSVRVNSRGRRSLRRIAAIMNKYPSVRIVVTGHIDSQEAAEQAAKDPADDSGDLSLERARAVHDYLVGHGIRAWRVRMEGRGAREPVADDSSRRGRAKNRRAAIVLRVYGPQK